MRKRKYISVKELTSRTFRTFNLSRQWTDHLGEVEVGATILIWGESRQGKTSYAVQMAKAFAMGDARTLYMPLEEGPSLSFQRALKNAHAEDARRLMIAPTEMRFEDLDAVMAERTAPDVVVIDSIQYSGINYDDYRSFRNAHPKKTLIFTSHADGRDPRGTTASSIKYDAGVKVFVKDYVANAGSRYGGGKPFEIWPEKVAEMELE